MSAFKRIASLTGKPEPAPKEKASLGENVLVKLIIGKDRLPDPPRAHPKGYIHVSGLIRGECPRFLSLQRRFNEFAPNQVNGATRIMWKIGRAAEQHVREQLIAALPSEQVYGQWICPCGKRKREGHSFDKFKCVHCGHPAVIYVELDLESDTYFVTGHPDFILILDGRIYPVEIKSLTNSKSANDRGEGFNTLTAPFTTHTLQVSCYHRMLVPLSKQLGIPLGDSAIVLYVSKDFDGFRTPYPYKEFHVNPYEHKPIIQELFEDARAAYRGINGVLPDRLNSCSSPGTKCAAGCPLVHQCFALGNGLTLENKTIKHLRE